MKTVTTSMAQSYRPASPVASDAAGVFVDKLAEWSQEFRSAQNALREYVRKHVGEPLGFLSRDPLNMSVFGIVLEKGPTQGFLAAPSALADGFSKKGVRGEAFFPDTSHPIGSAASALMARLSRIAEQRPLLNGVPGVAPVAVANGRVVLSRALRAPNGDITIQAAPNALSPDAPLIPRLPAEAASGPLLAVQHRTHRP